MAQVLVAATVQTQNPSKRELPSPRKSLDPSSHQYPQPKVHPSHYISQNHSPATTLSKASPSWFCRQTHLLSSVQLQIKTALFLTLRFISSNFYSCALLGRIKSLPGLYSGLMCSLFVSAIKIRGPRILLLCSKVEPRSCSYAAVDQLCCNGICTIGALGWLWGQDSSSDEVWKSILEKWFYVFRFRRARITRYADCGC
jgi:hypothetical protein